MESLKARFRAPPAPNETHGILREREVRGRGTNLSEERGQKNLRVLRRDAERMERMARQDGISQTKLMSLALDAYEEIKGGQ